MLRVYRAILRGDRVQWIDQPPKKQRPIPVHITLIQNEPNISHTRGESMASALENLAHQGGLKHIVDPTAWQKQIREDKPLMGRD